MNEMRGEIRAKEDWSIEKDGSKGGLELKEMGAKED